MKPKEYNVDGLVRSMDSITGSFRAFKVVMVVCVIVTLLVCLGCVYVVGVQQQLSASRVYIMDNGASVVSATAQDASYTREAEVRDQVRRFHEYFFNIPPDETMVRQNLEKALELADHSAYDYHQTLKEKGFYRNLSSTDSFQQIDVRDIEVNMLDYPYSVTVRSDLYISRPSNIGKYTLVSSCRVEEVPRSDKNLHGLRVASFRVIENAQVEVRKK